MPGMQHGSHDAPAPADAVDHSGHDHD